MAKFSGVLQLTDLDDFITPSQECVKPDYPCTFKVKLTVNIVACAKSSSSFVTIRFCLIS